MSQKQDTALPWVSIIVPVYKVERYLMRCIRSLTCQTLENIEIILVDDGSPDSCPALCDAAAAEDRRIRVIHKENQGLGLARNSGLAAASGEYVYFVDSDDYISRTAAQVLYDAARKEDLDICFAGIYLEDGRGRRWAKLPRYAGKKLMQPEITAVVLKGMLGAEPRAKEETELRMSVWQGIYRRAWLEKHHLNFPSERDFISEDIMFHLDALPRAESMRYLTDCVYYHIVDNPASLTHRYDPERFHKDSILYLEEKRRISQIKNHEGMLERAQRMYLGNVRVCLKQIVQQAKNEEKGFADREIKKIVNSSTLQEVLKTYPYFKNPPKQAVMSLFLKYKLVYPVRYATGLFLMCHEICDIS